MTDESLQCLDGGGEVQAVSQTAGAVIRLLQSYGFSLTST